MNFINYLLLPLFLCFNGIWYLFYSLTDSIPRYLSYACLVLRLLYDVAIDAFDKPNCPSANFRSPSHKHIEVYMRIYLPV